MDYTDIRYTWIQHGARRKQLLRHRKIWGRREIRKLNNYWKEIILDREVIPSGRRVHIILCNSIWEDLIWIRELSHDPEEYDKICDLLIFIKNHSTLFYGFRSLFNLLLRLRFCAIPCAALNMQHKVYLRWERFHASNKAHKI